MDGTSVLILIGFGFLIFLAIKNSIRNSAERDGRAGKYEPSKLKADAKVNDVKVYTVGSKTNKSFRIVVYFDDSFNYAKVVKPTMRDDHFMSTTYTLSVEDKTNVIKEAIEQHALAINNNQKNKNVSSGNALLDFNNAIFPNGDSSRNYQKNQLRVLMGDIDDENNYLKTFIYCLTHYLVNNENYQYVIKMLPIAHPEIKEEKAIKRIAAYTFIFAGTKKENLDLSKIEDMKFVDETVEKLDQQIKDVEKNSKMNEQPFDIERGTVREKPMFFKGVKATESYLNSLTDENGNKLHFGDRYCYSVDGINGMLDCYTMLDSNNDVYGQLYVSIYGADNYKYVPKGYLHPSLKNPDVEKTKEEQEDKSEQQNNNDVSFKGSLK